MVERPRVPTYEISYNGTGITADIKELVEKIEIVDKLEGESDELSITLNNYDLRWFNNWIVQRGDRITVRIGYVGEQLSAPVTYEVDEPTFSFAPDTIQLKGTATPVSTQLRAKLTERYEMQTLPAIAGAIAAKHGLALVGDIPPITFKRLTQDNETDLSFLRRISNRFGCIFKVESSEKLVFNTEFDLESRGPVFQINRRKMRNSSSLKGKTVDTYKTATTQYRDPKTGTNYTHTAETPLQDVGTDDLKVTGERFENEGQATLRAREALRKRNAERVTGTIDLEGEPGYVPGINFQFTGIGAYSGKYQIRQVRHSITVAQGYTSHLDVRLVTLEPEFTEPIGVVLPGQTQTGEF